MRKSKRISDLVAACALLIGVSGAVAAPAPIWNFNFNDPQNGVTTVNTGSDSNPNTKLTMENYTGASTPTNHRTATGTGVSGQPNDYAFTTFTTSNPPDPYAYVPGAQNGGISGLNQVTLTGWYNLSKPIPLISYTRTFLWGNRSAWSEGMVVDFNAQSGASNQLGLEVNDYYSPHYGGDAYWPVSNTTGQWVFWAITYDGTQQSNNVSLYMGGSASTLIKIGAAKTIAHDPNTNLNGTIFNGGGDFVVGADKDSGYGNGVSGLQDNLRVYSGLLSPNDMESIRETDLASGRLIGDATGDGKIDLGNDFNLLMQGMLAGGTGWTYGDFNFDGKIDSTDFGMFIDGYRSSGGSLGAIDTLIVNSPLLTTSQKASFLATVPEPSMIGVAGLIAGMFAMRRRSLMAVSLHSKS